MKNETAKKLASLETIHSHPNQHHHDQLICWKSAIAGVIISIMTYMILTALGAGIGGLTASSMINNERSGSGLATAAGIWMGLSVAVSLFLGSYFSLRVSHYVTQKVGVINGIFISSLFFILLIWGTGHSIGALSKGLGKITESFVQSTEQLSTNPFIQDTINKALGNSKLKSEPTEVIQGLSLRLLRGDTDSAKSYYAYQTGLTLSEVDTKVTQMKNEFDQAVKDAGEKTANAIAEAGWILFVVFLVGVLAAIIGGREGAQANHDRPIVKLI